jgi:hypothetical protein
MRRGGRHGLLTRQPVNRSLNLSWHAPSSVPEDCHFQFQCSAAWHSFSLVALYVNLM